MPVHRQAVREKGRFNCCPPEQQPSGVQVVEWVGLVAGGFCIAVQFSAPILLFFSIHKNIGHLNG